MGVWAYVGMRGIMRRFAKRGRRHPVASAAAVSGLTALPMKGHYCEHMQCVYDTKPHRAVQQRMELRLGLRLGLRLIKSRARRVHAPLLGIREGHTRGLRRDGHIRYNPPHGYRRLLRA